MKKGDTNCTLDKRGIAPCPLFWEKEVLVQETNKCLNPPSQNLNENHESIVVSFIARTLQNLAPSFPSLIRAEIITVASSPIEPEAKSSTVRLFMTFVGPLIWVGSVPLIT